MIAGGNLGTYLNTFVIVSNNANDGGFFYNVTRGSTYRFKYRAQNVIGWSNFSPVSYIQAATKPSAPKPINHVSSTSTSVTINIAPCLDN